jgi:hypothetical protein
MKDSNGIIRSEFRHVPLNDNSSVHNLILDAMVRHSSDNRTRIALVSNDT